MPNAKKIDELEISERDKQLAKRLDYLRITIRKDLSNKVIEKTLIDKI